MSGPKRRGKRKHRGPALFPIIYEDKDLILINKPAGLLSVPIKGMQVKNARDMLNEYLRSEKKKAIIVHRIDRYTSGIMVFAKSQPAHAKLVKQFLDHTPRRIYLALVRGHPQPAEGELRHYLKLIKRGFRQVAVSGKSEGGTLAVTNYRVKEYFPDTALLEIQLDTGLKNQIRVQLNEVGHTIVGDRHYKPAEKKVKEIDHQALHAYRLGFVHPGSGKYVEFEAKLPKDFSGLLSRLRRERDGSD